MDLFPIVLLLLAFGLLVVLPARQRKKMAAKTAEMQQSLVPGTPIMLTSGIHGTVLSRGEGTVDVEIAPGVVVTVVQAAVLEIRRPAGGAVTGVGDAATPGASSPGNGSSASGTGYADGDADPTDRSR